MTVRSVNIKIILLISLIILTHTLAFAESACWRKGVVDDQIKEHIGKKGYCLIRYSLEDSPKCNRISHKDAHLST